MDDTISGNKRLNQASKEAGKSSEAAISLVQIEKSGLATLMDFAERSNMIDLEILLEKRITEECLSMYNVDGSMRKNS